MSKFKSIKVKYVALYFGDFLPDLMEMTIEEKGIYVTLCMKIYAAGGWILNKTSVLASICGISEENFIKHFANIKRKFKEEGEFLTQKRCLFELKEAAKRMKSQSERGKKGAKSRWDKGLIHPIPMKDSNSTGITQAMAALQPIEKTRTNTRTDKKELSNTSNNINPVFNKILDNIIPTNKSSVLPVYSSSDSSSDFSRQISGFEQAHTLNLYNELQKYLVIKSFADRKGLDNLCRFAARQIAEGRANEGILKQIIDLADEAKQKAKTNRWGYFWNIVKRDTGYVPPSKQN